MKSEKKSTLNTFLFFKFLIRHPLIFLLGFAFMAMSTFSFLAHFNPGIAERFGNASRYFIGATLFSEASDAVRVAQKKLKVADAHTERRITEATADMSKQIREKDAEISRKNERISKQSKLIEKNKATLRKSIDASQEARRVMRLQNTVIKSHEANLDRFRTRSVVSNKTVKNRFKKMAIMDSAGGFLGVVPVVGDVASLGLAGMGIYEMCEMFREIEEATAELGATYKVYTDTFCEKASDATVVVVAEKAGAIKGKFVAVSTVFKEYAASVNLPNNEALTRKVQGALDSTWTKLKETVGS